MPKRKWADKWRDFHCGIQIEIPTYDRLRAEATVCGCSIGEVVKAKVEFLAKMMLTKPGPESPSRPFSDYTGEELEAMSADHEAQLEYEAKVVAQIELDAKNMLVHKMIARRKAIESKMKKAGAVK